MFTHHKPAEGELVHTASARAGIRSLLEDISDAVQLIDTCVLEVVGSGRQFDSLLAVMHKLDFLLLPLGATGVCMCE